MRLKEKAKQEVAEEAKVNQKAETLLPLTKEKMKEIVEYYYLREEDN